MGTILAIEDDPRILKALQRLFSSEGYEIRSANNGKQGLELFAAPGLDGVVLDLMLPGMSGRDICRSMKQANPDIPVIILSAISDVADKVLLLELGADDYVTKPFSPRELLARVQAAIRRSKRSSLRPSVTFGEVQVDFATMRATRGGKPVTLTAHEFKLLRFFLDNPERVLSRDELLTLQMVGLFGAEEKPATVRAMVRSVHPPASLRELQQVGVELEAPSNVWGILSPPADWLGATETKTSTAKLAGVFVPGQESGAQKAGEIVMKPEPKVPEVASFPAPSPAAAQPAVPKVAEAARPPRVVVKPDQLISALQGKLQQAAEKAVQAAVAKQVNDLVREALSSIDEARRSSAQEVQELFPKQVEGMKLSLKEEFATEMVAQWQADIQAYRGRAEETAQRLEKQAEELRRDLANAQEYVDKLTREIASSVPASLKETVNQATSDFESATAVIADRRYEGLLENVQLVTHDALSKLNARSAEVQAVVQSALNSGLEEFRRETELHVNMALAETKERAVSALSSLDAESRANCDARRQALEAEVARSAERAAEQFHKGIKAFLHNCVVAAVGAMDEHSKSTLDELLKNEEKTLDHTLNG